jgi:hypothetical protein
MGMLALSVVPAPGREANEIEPPTVARRNVAAAVEVVARPGQTDDDPFAGL